MLEPYIRLFINYADWFISDLFLLIALGTGLICYRYVYGGARWLFWLLVLSFFVELLLIHYAALSKNNHFLLNVSSIIETACLAGMYYSIIMRKWSRIFIVVSFLIYLSISIYSFEWLRIADYMLGVQRLMMIVYVILYFQYLLSELKVDYLMGHSFFWISAGALLYASGTLFIFLFVKITFGNPNDGDFSWYMHFAQAFNSFFYITLAVGFWLQRREIQLEQAKQGYKLGR
ncbi:hypothetical protein [Tellurirhabdus bombi]|uniref:hypothetical protein n=1 Tax=Tellurirhabdus bombi TaxID=2907205 RepID=UPI001F44AD4C|nr:hypothetical protein [Tellurirhabdus bombi]